jgi:hypothetical protein
MNSPVNLLRISRRALLKGGALTVGFALAGLPAHAVAQGAAATSRVLDPGRNAPPNTSSPADRGQTAFNEHILVKSGRCRWAFRLAIRNLEGR